MAAQQTNMDQLDPGLWSLIFASVSSSSVRNFALASRNCWHLSWSATSFDVVFAHSDTLNEHMAALQQKINDHDMQVPRALRLNCPAQMCHCLLKHSAFCQPRCACCLWTWSTSTMFRPAMSRPCSPASWPCPVPPRTWQWPHCASPQPPTPVLSSSWCAHALAVTWPGTLAAGRWTSGASLLRSGGAGELRRTAHAGVQAEVRFCMIMG